MRRQIPVALAVLATALGSCDHAVGPTGPTLRARYQDNAGTHEVQRYTTEVFVAQPTGSTIDGPVTSVSKPAGAVTATVETGHTELHVTCHARGTGEFHVPLKGPDGQLSTYKLNIKCVDRIAGNTTHPVNLTEHFAEQGRVVVSIAVDPAGLAEQVVINESLVAFVASGWFARGVNLSDASYTSGDIGLKCHAAGEGILFVTFESGSDDYDLSCAVEHSQGSGS